MREVIGRPDGNNDGVSFFMRQKMRRLRIRRGYG